MMINAKNTTMKDESAKLCSSLCIRTLAMSISLPRILLAIRYRWNADTLEPSCSRSVWPARFASAFASRHRRSLAFERSQICVVIDGIRSPWNLLVSVVQEMITVTKNCEHSAAFFGVVHSSAITDVGHEALWLAC